MHQALYRKWRPRDFDDVCGQDHITSILKNEVSEGKINHAYLFCGSRGTGKTTCAKILAKAVNCFDYKDGKVCGKCPACLSADAGNASDIIEMDAASNNGVSNIRDIRDEVNYLPSELKYKVYIVDEVHMLSTSAFNALLKTLEEPPSHVIFILATTELQKLPSTIVSRCQRFEFRRISSNVIADRLEYIAQNENIELEREAAYEIAAIAQGGMRDAISLFELCANASPDASVNEDIVAKLVGTGERDIAERAVRAVIAKDYDAIFATTAKIHMSARDMSVFWQSVVGLYRDMLVIKTSTQAKDYLDLSDKKFEILSELAQAYSMESLVYHIRILDEAYAAMQKNTADKRLCAECALVRMCDEKLSANNDALAVRISKLERALAGGVTVDLADAGKINPDKKTAASEVRETYHASNVKESDAVPVSEKTAQITKKIENKEEIPRTVRRLKSVPYYADVLSQFGSLYPMEASFLEDAKAYTDENGKIRIRVGTDMGIMMLQSQEVFSTLLGIFNTFENGRLDASSLLLETEQFVKNDSLIDEIIDSSNE